MPLPWPWTGGASPPWPQKSPTVSIRKNLLVPQIEKGRKAYLREDRFAAPEAGVPLVAFRYLLPSFCGRPVDHKKDPKWKNSSPQTDQIQPLL